MDYRKIDFEKGKGLYIILDLKTLQKDFITKLQDMLKEQVLAVQIWDNMPDYSAYAAILKDLVRLLKTYETPILMNNRLDLVEAYQFDGVHFDEIPADWDDLLPRLAHKIVGITCTNNREILEWADRQRIDYVSFCSMYPSANNSRCELVDPEVVAEFQGKYKIPFFLAGGITPENIDTLSPLSYSGIALVSGLMTRDNPRELLKNVLSKMS